MLPQAAAAISAADRLLIVGTSLLVYPAAGLIHYAPPDSIQVLVDPKPVEHGTTRIHVKREPASLGVPDVVEEWLAAIS